MNQDATRLIESGHILQAQGRLDEAMQCYLDAIGIAPNPARAHLNHGNVLLLKGDLQGALDAFRTAIKYKPDYAGAYYNIGNALLNEGKLDDAVANFRQALEIQPDYAEVHCSLGVALQGQRRLEDAVASHQRALEIKPDFLEAHINLGNALQYLSQFDKAAACYLHALEFTPDNGEALFCLGTALRAQGKYAEAEIRFGQAFKIDPQNERFRITLMFRVPITVQTAAESRRVATDFDQSLQDLCDWMLSVPEKRAKISEALLLQNNFYLAYRDENHVTRLSRFGDCLIPGSDAVQFKSSTKREKLRLVVVSKHFRRHSVWDVILRGILVNLDRSQFEVVLYHMGDMEDEETQLAKSLSDIWRDFRSVKGLTGWLDAMASDQPDIIFYPEIGMDIMTLRLATRRLAPLQVASWGHPITTGLPTIDLFFSGELLEPSEADTHYREQLVRLPGTGCCTTPFSTLPEALPELSAELAKRRGPRFVIAQMPFKFDPADDALFANIAANAGECTFILLRAPEFPWITEQLISRLSQAFRERNLDPAQYLLAIPWLSSEKFYTLLDLCDIYLDCPSFSGYTTAWQAVQRGLPVVTLEGRFLRQRLAAGLLRKIGMADTVASSKDDYIKIAACLAAECRDADHRNARRDALKVAAAQLTSDISVVRAFEQSLIKGLDR